MKKLIILLSCALTVIACKNDKKTEATEEVNNEQAVELAEGEVVLEGEFIYTADAAVLKGTNFIYGVVLDDKSAELATKVAPMKKSQFDMVPVKIKAVVKPNPAKEGWEQVIEIKDILGVFPISETAENSALNINVTQ